MIGTAIGLVAVLIAPLYARPLGTWTYNDLFSKSDFVGIVKVTNIKETTAKLRGHGDPNCFMGKQAELVIQLSLKGKQDKPITFNFFAFNQKHLPPPDGAMFIDFGKAASVDYLVFLKKTAGGSLEPVTGNYDASPSFHPVERGGFMRPVE